MRRSVPVVLFRLQARIEGDTVEQARMHLGGITAALLIRHQKDRGCIFVDLGLRLELEQRYRRIAAEPPGE